MSRVSFWLLLLLLLFALYGKVTQFAPWIDDTKLLWATRYHLPSTLPYYNHPGLPLSFLFYSVVFADQYVYWQLAGLGLKLVIAVFIGRMIYMYTGSARLRDLTRILFIVSVLGYEVYAAPIMNVSGIVAIPILLYFTDLWLVLQGKTNRIRRCIYWFLSGLLLDPGRMFSVLLLTPVVVLYVNQRLTAPKFSKQKFAFLVFSLLLLLPLLSIWFTRFVASSQLMIGLQGLIADPIVYAEKLTRTGNAFAAIGNSYVHNFFPMQHNEQHTGVYQRQHAAVGIAVCVIGVVLLGYGMKKRKKNLWPIGFFMLWSFVFYLPNWFSEPRAPMAAPHRYLFLSGLGTTAVISLLIYCLRVKFIIVTVSLIVVTASLFQAQGIISRQSQFRDIGVVSSIWNTIDGAVPYSEDQYVFVFDGAQPYLSQTLELFGSDRFGLIRKIQTPQLLPIVTTDKKQIEGFISGSTQPRKLFYGNVTADGLFSVQYVYD